MSPALRWLSAGLLLTALAAPAAAYRPRSEPEAPASKRTVFRYEKGTFKQKGGAWVERRDNGDESRFVETHRGDEFIELYDRDRDLRVRLYDGQGMWHDRASDRWFPWPGSNGTWQKD